VQPSKRAKTTKLRRNVFIHAKLSNGPQQRPRATDVIRNHDRLAGSASCDGYTSYLDNAA
jgi:hypothetical protein